ncbi:MAG: glycosyltransferase [Bacteroidales bacterium]|nr:MAG: glycosyltransferase [Bacteroidales bacterium]
MKNKTIPSQLEDGRRYVELLSRDSYVSPKISQIKSIKDTKKGQIKDLTEILFITSYPPRECGIATYSQDLTKALNNKFSNSLSIKVCALESGIMNYNYPEEVEYTLNTTNDSEYGDLAKRINANAKIKIVLIQHEFGFYRGKEQPFLHFLYALSKPIVIVFHTVLPNPDERLKAKVKDIVAACESIIVMTNSSAETLINDYGLSRDKISVIAHGTHLVPHSGEDFLKQKYGLKDRKVLSTFGLLSSGKSLETTLEALPAIVEQSPEVIFLIIGKTHPEVVKNEGEEYREMLEEKVKQLGLHDHVKFINSYLALPELLEYLQLSDIYLFTSTDPNQAVSGTFVYAMSCACPIISTPIPHAREILTSDTGILFDFKNSKQLADAVIRLLSDEPLRRNISTNTLQKIVSTAWENSAVAHAMLFDSITNDNILLHYNMPLINLNHLKLMTTKTGIIQFSKINQPDISTGYTLDDNARALVAICMYFKLTGDAESLTLISKYLRFIKFCQQSDGDFLNYVDSDNQFTNQNKDTNLDDANGRAIWALGYLISLANILPDELIVEANIIFKEANFHIRKVHSTRAMAFAIKGLYYYNSTKQSAENTSLIKLLADRLVQMYVHEANNEWEWFEGYLTYANSILPEAMLFAWLITGEVTYKDIAKSSLKFLISQTFNENGIEVISNKNWLRKGEVREPFGEQPIDVAYTIMTLSKFYEVFKDEDYRSKREIAFNWFLGKNRLHQIVYNPCTGGCYDGLEETHVNLNQGAESTVSYLMARLIMENDNNELSDSKDFVKMPLRRMTNNTLQPINFAKIH